MASVSVDAFDPDRRLDDLLALYLEEVEAGRPPDRSAWLAKHPDLAAELSAFFANLDHVGRIAGPLREHPSPPILAFPTAVDAVAEGGRVGYFGDYELIREIARGGMGVVYAARQVSLDRLLALKIIPAGPGTSEAELRRFRLEAEAVAQLDHPNLVPIYEAGEHAGHRYYSMKLVDGGTLATEGPRLRGDFAAIARLVATTARAIHYAHQRGILHRDLKPSNVLFDRQGRILVADFGLAKRIEAGGDLTQTGSIVGTPAYMAPEQTEGRREAVTTAVDVYGLGAILYDVLTGRPPYRGDSALETLRRVREDEPVRPSAIDRKVPRDLETICLKCLEKEPGRRYASAGALADDLDRWLAGLPIAARPATLLERAVKWARRRPMAAALLVTGAVAILAAAMAVRGMHAAGRLRDQFLSADSSRREEAVARRKAEAEVARRVERESGVEADRYFDKIAVAERAWASNDVAAAWRTLDDCPPKLRRWEWWYLRGLCRAEVRTIKGHSGMTCGVAFAPSESVYCFPDDRGGVGIWDDREDRAVSHISGHEGFAYGVAFDRAGMRLATAGSDGKVRLWDVASGRLLHAMPGHGAWAAGVAFTRAGTRLVSGGADRVVRVWDTADGSEVLALRGHSGAVLGVAVRPDGGQIASAGQEGAIKIWDAATGREGRTLPGDRETARCVAYSPDGTRLASGGADRRVRIWDPASGEERLAFPAASGRIDGIAFSPDGTRIATGALDRSVKVWDAATGRELASYRGHEAPVLGVAFSPDGTRLASSAQDATVKIWDATSAPEARVLRLPGRSAVGVALSRDGVIAAAASAEGGVTAWDAATGRKLWSSPDRGGVLSSLIAHPDGCRFVALGADRVVRGWDVASGAETILLEPSEEELVSLAVGPHGRRIATGDGEPITIIHGFRGKRVYQPSGGAPVRVWDAGTGQELLRMAGHVGSVHAVRFRGDGSQIASAGGDGTVRLWDAATGRELHVLSGHRSPVLDVAFSPDGTRVASAGADGTVRIWDAATGRERVALPAHSGWASAVAFSPDGSRLASAGIDGAVKLWAVASGREVLGLLRDGGRALGLAFGADGRRLAASSADGTVWIWSLPRGADLR